MALVMALEARPPGSCSLNPILSLWWPGSHSLVAPFPSPSQYCFYFCGFNKNFTSSSGLGRWGQCSWDLVSACVYASPNSGGLSRAMGTSPQPFTRPGSGEEYPNLALVMWGTLGVLEGVYTSQRGKKLCPVGGLSQISDAQGETPVVCYVRYVAHK